MGPMTIEPDTKDWTWVLERPCPECGLVAGDVDPGSVGATLTEHVTRWQRVLARPGTRERPRAEVWSPLEYAAHVRDVFDIFDERVRLMLTEDDPEFANWDQDAAAVDGDYAGRDPSELSDELAAAAERLVARLDAVPDDAWGRTGRRSNGSRFTIATLVQYLLHDEVHHLVDVDG